MELRESRALVLGKGKTGTSTVSFLEGKGARVTWKDEVEDGPFTLLHPLDYDLVVQSPGISRQHPFLLACDEAGVRITNEIELASRFATAPIIGVTGTNGKTTIVHLLQHLLAGCGLRSVLAGNVGHPFIGSLHERAEAYVVELSSYQLEGIDSFHPKIAVISNLTPDHLERHKTMERYLEIKERIYRNMDTTDTLILNWDDPRLRVVNPKGPRCLWFSRKEPVLGIYCLEERIILNLPGLEKEELLPTGMLKLIGDHNIENVMVAALAAVLMGLGTSCIRRKILSFPGVEHRLEYVSDVKGIPYFNDSKSTNPDAAIIALRAFPHHRVNLILGGSPKEVSYAELAKEIVLCNAKPILQGVTRDEIAMELEKVGCVDYGMAKDLKEALEVAMVQAKRDEVVVLSPACASFDQFDNFEHRGEVFKKYVKEYAGKQE